MKREKFLWPLTQEHHPALMLAKRIQEKLSTASSRDEGDRVREIAMEVRKLYDEVLCRHFWDEERLLTLYEGRMGENEPEPERVRKEHRLLETLMRKANRESLLAFAKTLKGHVRFEEDVFFGKVEKVLSEGEKQAAGNLLQQRSAACAAPSI